MFSIKTKLSIGISILITLLFSIAAYLLITEKRNELAHDIYVNAQNYSELTSKRVTNLYETLLKEYSFVLFNREITDVFRKDTDVSSIVLYTYGGEILYDSNVERDRQYSGSARTVSDAQLLKRIRSQLPNVSTSKSRVVYLKKNAAGVLNPVNEFESPILDVGATEKSLTQEAASERVISLVYPLDGKYAVEYSVTYNNLDDRVSRTTQRIILLTVFGILVGLGAVVVYSGQLTKPILDLTSNAEKLGAGDLKVRVTVTTHDEIGRLGDTFNKMAADLEVSTKAMIEREKLGRELDLAAKIQRQIIPKEMPKIDGLEISTALIPAEEVGGDCYDFIPVNDDTTVMYLSDVTGHGVPSSLVVSIANALMYSYAGQGTIKDLLVHVNTVLKKKTSQNMFMTLLMLQYQTQKNGTPKISMVSAGHPDMLHYSARTGEVTGEKGGGIALGMVPDIGKLLTEREVIVEKGDILVMYSDGIPEAGSESGAMFGDAAFKESLKKAATLPTCDAIRDAIVAEVKAFMGLSKQLDDITLVVLRQNS